MLTLSFEEYDSLWNRTGIAIRQEISQKMVGIEKEIALRSYRVSNETRNALLTKLREQKSGKTYKLPNSKATYTASASGEAPANRTGALRNSYGTKMSMARKNGNFVAYAGIESGLKSGGYLIGDLLESGTKYMDPRPFRDAVIEKVKPYADKVYSAPYNI